MDMSGNVTFYPKADMSEIYTKQLMQDGTSRILTYRVVMPEPDGAKESPVTLETIGGLLAQLKTEILSEIKAIIPEQIIPKTGRPKGGSTE